MPVGQRPESPSCQPHSNSWAKFPVWHPVSYWRCSRAHSYCKGTAGSKGYLLLYKKLRDMSWLSAVHSGASDLWETPFSDGLSERVGPAPLRRVRLPLPTSQLSFRKQSILHMQGTCPILPYSSSCKKGRDEKHDMFCFRVFFWRILMYTLLRCQLMKPNQASWTSLKSSCYNFKYNSSVHQNRREMAAASENGTATVPWDRTGFPH